MSKYVSLDDILGKKAEDLTAVKRGEITTEKLGTIPFCELNHVEYKRIKKDCMKQVPDTKSRGAYVSELDDDKLMVQLVIKAVDKESQLPDARSNFTFANKELLAKLGEVTAEGAAEKLLSIGEIYNAAMDIQDLCGFTEKAAQEKADEIKN